MVGQKKEEQNLEIAFRFMTGLGGSFRVAGGRSRYGFGAHREFLLRNGVGKICLWKKYILPYECIQKQGNKNF